MQQFLTQTLLAIFVVGGALYFGRYWRALAGNPKTRTKTVVFWFWLAVFNGVVGTLVYAVFLGAFVIRYYMGG